MLIKSRFCFYPFFNPFIYDEINRMGNYFGINKETKRDFSIVVSLDAHNENFNNLPIALYSLLNQSLKPDKIVLWLDEELYDLTTIPYEISRFIKNGLEIKFVKEIKSYTKSIYAFKNYKDSIIVTAEDNIFYPKDWLKRLYLSYISMQDCIHVHLAHKIELKKDIQNKDKQKNDTNISFNNIMEPAGGILYPPNCFTKEAYREDVFSKFAPYSDEIWFWLMAIIHNKKINVIKNHYKYLPCLNFFELLKNNNKKHLKEIYDEPIDLLMKYYGQNIINKL